MKDNPNNFDFIRLVAASMVIWGHAHPLLAQPGLPGIMGSSIHTFAVKVFFAVSGYLIVASWVKDPNPLRFLTKRLVRIVPALAVVVTVSALVLGPSVTNLPLSEYFTNPLFFDYFRNILLEVRYALPGVFEDNIYPIAVNGSLWTLPVEFFMYALVLAVGWTTLFLPGQFMHVFWSLLTLIILALIVVRATAMPELFDGVVIYGMLVSASLELAPYFMVGGLMSVFSRFIPHSLIAAIVLFGIGVFFTGTGTLIYVLNIFFVCYAVVVFGTMSTPYIRRTGRFGDLSYGVYLYGFPVAQTLSWAFTHEIPFQAHIFFALAISMILAFFSWHLVEKPALSFKPKRTDLSRQL